MRIIIQVFVITLLDNFSTFGSLLKNNSYKSTTWTATNFSELSPVSLPLNLPVKPINMPVSLAMYSAVLSVTTTSSVIALSTLTFTPKNLTTSFIAFVGIRSKPWTGCEYKISFDKLITIGPLNAYSENTYVTPSSGCYWLYMFTDIGRNELANATLYAGFLTLSLKFGPNEFEFDIVSRSAIAQLDDGEHLFEISRHNLVATTYNRTYFSGFSLSSVFVSLVAFMAVSVATTLDKFNRVQFNHVILNEGDGWRSSDNSFLAPIDGIYYLSVYSGGMFDKTATPSLNLYIKTNLLLSLAFSQIINPSEHHCHNVLNGAVVRSLSKHDAIFVSVPNLPSNAVTGIETTICGYLYSPQDNALSAAWSLLISAHYTPNCNNCSKHKVLLQSGMVAVAKDSSVSIHLTGYYYLYVDLEPLRFGMAESAIHLNGRPLLVVSFCCEFNMFCSRTRNVATLTALRKADTLTIGFRKEPNFKTVIFDGLLLYPSF